MKMRTPTGGWRPARLAAALLACGLLAGAAARAAEATPGAPAPKREELTIDVDAQVSKPWLGDLDGMVERRIIRVLTAYSKTFYFLDKGVQRGISYDAFTLFEQDLNKKLAQAAKAKKGKGAAGAGSKHLKVRVVFIPVGRDRLLQDLADGKGDIAAANLTITPDRRKLVDFSAPVHANVSEVVVSGPASPAVASVDDLSGKTVFVRKSSSYFASLTALNERFAAARRPPVVIKEAPETLEDEDLLEMLNGGLIPLIVVDRHKADFWKQVFPKVTVHADVAVRTGAEIGWAIRKGSPQLKAALDDFIRRNGEGSAAKNTLLAKYFKSAKYVKDAASDAERTKFLALIDYFRTYGDKYDVDWLLMAAQGYQESQLNQGARSPVGAIGVMQVMPATAKDLKVGDITQTEANIHAGVKYMRWMIDQYYGKEPMTKLDKALFAFASYNAGAGRIAQLRALAAKRGLDPNVWFHNVEYVAAEKIGAETVTYVGNIYKYFIAYNLIMEARAAKEQAVQGLKGQGK